MRFFGVLVDIATLKVLGRISYRVCMWWTRKLWSTSQPVEGGSMEKAGMALGGRDDLAESCCISWWWLLSLPVAHTSTRFFIMPSCMI